MNEIRNVAAATFAGTLGLFVDGFNENIFKRVFHNKELMARLGDVLLNKNNISEFFDAEDLALIPFSWFTALDRLYIRALGWKHKIGVRRLSKWHEKIDNLIPKQNRFALWLSDHVLTKVVFH